MDQEYTHIYIYIGGLMGDIYIYPKSCNLQLMDSLSLFLYTLSKGDITCSNIFSSSFAEVSITTVCPRGLVHFHEARML